MHINLKSIIVIFPLWVAVVAVDVAVAVANVVGRVDVLLVELSWLGLLVHHRGFFPSTF